MALILNGAPPAVQGKAYWGASHEIEIRDFYDCLASGRSFPLEGAAGYPALNLVKAIQQSAATAGHLASIVHVMHLAQRDAAHRKQPLSDAHVLNAIKWRREKFNPKFFAVAPSGGRK